MMHGQDSFFANSMVKTQEFTNSQSVSSFKLWRYCGNCFAVSYKHSCQSHCFSGSYGVALKQFLLNNWDGNVDLFVSCRLASGYGSGSHILRSHRRVFSSMCLSNFLTQCKYTHTILLSLMLVSLAYHDLWNSRLEVEMNPRKYKF